MPCCRHQHSGASPHPRAAQGASPSPTTTCGRQFSYSHKCLPCSGEHPSFIISLISAFIIFLITVITQHMNAGLWLPPPPPHSV